MTPGRIFLLTGEIGTGKTSLCQDTAAEARKRGWKLGGLLSPGVFVGDEKRGIDLINLADGERRRLAVLREDGESSLATRRWAFDPEVTAWGNRQLLTAVPCDLLLIDELGPLEFERGQGWTNAFPVLHAGQFRSAVVVVRPGLLPLAREQWGSPGVINISRRDQGLDAAGLLDRLTQVQS